MPASFRPYLITGVAIATLLSSVSVSAQYRGNGPVVEEADLKLDVEVPLNPLPPQEGCFNFARYLFEGCVAANKMSDLECYIKYMLPTEISCECKRPIDERPSYCRVNSQEACDKFFDQCLLIANLRYQACLRDGPPNESDSWGDPGLTCEGRKLQAVIDCQLDQQICTCNHSDLRMCNTPLVTPPLG